MPTYFLGEMAMFGFLNHPAGMGSPKPLRPPKKNPPGRKPEATDRWGASDSPAPQPPEVLVDQRISLNQGTLGPEDPFLSKEIDV